MSQTKFKEIIDFAINREEDAIAGYAQMVVIAKSAALKELLEDLKKEEEKHKELLQGISRDKIESLETEADVADLKISDYLVEEPMKPEMTFRELLVYAAKKEQKAVELYTDLKKTAKYEELEKLFDFLIEQEKSHKLKVETEYERHVYDAD